MDPISLAIGAVGLGMQIFGGIGQSHNAHQAAEISQDVARQEQGINNAKQQQMELEGRRTQMENIRNSQRARALAENSAVSQGAQFGSGLQGGLAQIQDQSLFNMSGVNGALEIGRNINDLNQNISNDRVRLAGVQADSATNAGITSLGGALIKAGPIVGQLSQGFGGFGFGSRGASATVSGTPGYSNTGGLY